MARNLQIFIGNYLPYRNIENRSKWKSRVRVGPTSPSRRPLATSTRTWLSPCPSTRTRPRPTTTASRPSSAASGGPRPGSARRAADPAREGALRRSGGSRQFPFTVRAVRGRDPARLRLRRRHRRRGRRRRCGRLRRALGGRRRRRRAVAGRRRRRRRGGGTGWHRGASRRQGRHFGVLGRDDDDNRAYAAAPDDSVPAVGCVEHQTFSRSLESSGIC